MKKPKLKLNRQQFAAKFPQHYKHLVEHNPKLLDQCYPEPPVTELDRTQFVMSTLGLKTKEDLMAYLNQS